MFSAHVSGCSLARRPKHSRRWLQVAATHIPELDVAHTACDDVEVPIAQPRRPHREQHLQLATLLAGFQVAVLPCASVCTPYRKSVVVVQADGDQPPHLMTRNVLDDADLGGSFVAQVERHGTEGHEGHATAVEGWQPTHFCTRDGVPNGDVLWRGITPMDMSKCPPPLLTCHSTSTYRPLA